MKRSISLAVILLAAPLSAPSWAQPRQWNDDFTTVATYNTDSRDAPCSGGPSTKYSMIETLSGDVFNERAVSGGGRLTFTNRARTGLLGRMEMVAVGVLNTGQGCPDVAGLGFLETTQPFTSNNICMYGGFVVGEWDTRYMVDDWILTGADGQPGVAGVDDDLDGVTDDDDESPGVRPTTVNNGYGYASGTGFRAGLDAAPGVAGVDDDGNGIVDDYDEIGTPGSDDGDDKVRQNTWFMFHGNFGTSSSIHVEIDMLSVRHLINLRHLVNGSDSRLEAPDEVTGGFFQPDTHYNWVLCNSGTCFGAVLWTGPDMANPDETLGPLTNSQHTAAADNIAGFGFYQNTQPYEYMRCQRIPGNTNFCNSYWVISGNPSQFYPPPSADLDKDKDVDGFDFLTFSNCYNGSNKAPLAACASLLADLDVDGDVDGFDFLTFSNCYNGSNRRPLAACFPPNLTACGS